MRRSCPQTPIRKYIGMSMTSQNTKKSTKSREAKTPIIPVESQQEEEELLHAALDTRPRDQHRKWREKSRQQNQEGAQAIDPQMVIDRRHLHPGTELFELHAGTMGVKAQIEPDGQQESGQRGEEGDPANGAFPLAPQKGDDGCAQKRQESYERQEV